MIDTLIAWVVVLCRISTVLPIAVLVYAVRQRVRHGVKIATWFLFWAALNTVLNVPLQWFQGPVWLHMLIFAFWTVSLMICVFVGLKEFEELAVQVAVIRILKQVVRASSANIEIVEKEESISE